MSDKRTLERARRKAREGKFVREELEDIRKGRHGARSAKQAIAIGLSKARLGVKDTAPPRIARRVPY